MTTRAPDPTPLHIHSSGVRVILAHRTGYVLVVEGVLRPVQFAFPIEVNDPLLELRQGVHTEEVRATARVT